MITTSRTLCTRCNRLVHRAPSICEFCGEGLIQTAATAFEPSTSSLEAEVWNGIEEEFEPRNAKSSQSCPIWHVIDLGIAA